MDTFREFPDGPVVRTLLTEWPEKKKKEKQTWINLNAFH